MCRTHIVYQVNNGLLLLAYFRSEASSSAVDLWRYMAGKKWTSLIDKRKSSLLYRRGLFLEWSSPEQEGLTRTWIKIIDFHRNETQRIWGSVFPQFFSFSNRKRQEMNERYSSLRCKYLIHCILQGRTFFATKRKGEWSAAAAVGYFEDRCGCEWLAKQSWAKLNFCDYENFQPSDICLYWPMMSTVLFYMTLLKVVFSNWNP